MSDRLKKKNSKASKTKRSGSKNNRGTESEAEKTAVGSDRKKNKRGSKKEEDKTNLGSSYERNRAVSKISSRSKKIYEPEQQSDKPAVSPDVKSESKEKWIGEEVSRSFVDKIDAAISRSEYLTDIKEVQVDRTRCSIWTKNMRKNQDEKYPCYDNQILKNSQSATDYVNATAVTVPHIQKPIILGQIPRKEVEGAVEEFWKTIFQENVMLIHILTGDDEVVDFFPQVANAYEHFGSMFVNNRKVEKPDQESVRFLMEVLPTGFSNSIMINIVLHFGWQSHNVPAKFGKTVKSVVDVHNFGKSSLPDEKSMIISKHGCGRAGFFLSLTSAIAALNQKVEPRIVEIVRQIRTQRPFAVESLKQYTSLYLCIVYYIKKKIGDPAFADKVKLINDSFKNMLEGAGASVMQ